MRAAGEDEFVAEGKSGHKCEAGRLVVEIDGDVANAFVAVGEARWEAGFGFVEFLDVGGYIVGVVDMRETDAGEGAVVDVVGVAIHVAEFAVFPVQAGVSEEDSLVVLGVGFGVGNVVYVAAVGAEGPGKGGSEGEFEDGILKVGDVGGVSKQEAECYVGVVFVIDVVVDAVVVAIGAVRYFMRTIGPLDDSCASHSFTTYADVAQG